MKKVIVKNKKAFTLVELLATIVILGVLLLIAVPSISEVINKSKKEVLLTDAKMYLNAAKLQFVANENDKDVRLINISDIETKTGNSNYSGKILALKNRQTGEYKYSIFMVDETTHRSVGKLRGTIPVFVDSLTKENMFQISPLAYSEYKLQTNSTQNSFYVETEQGYDKKTMLPNGELFDLEGNMINNTIQQVYAKTKEYGILKFYVLNDVGERMLLLLDPNDYEKTRMKYADSNGNGNSDIQEYISNYEELTLVDIDNKENKENFYVRLLNVFDIYQLYGGTDSSIEGITKLLKENKDTLTNMFYRENSYKTLTNDLENIEYTPTLIVNQNDDIFVANNACNSNGEITLESNSGGTECYGLNMVSAAFDEGNFITLHSGNFFVRLVMEVEKDQREYFYTNQENIKDSRLKNFG